MTVCLAAICEGRTIIGASDRMLTAGGIIQYEPKKPKIEWISNAIAAMTAGDSALQVEILRDVFTDVGDRIRQNPADWWLVRDVAALYSHHYARERMRRAEWVILTPLGLTADTFISRQGEMSAEFIADTAARLRGFQLSNRVETLIVGVDPGGAHIYRLRDGEASCHDSVGFAAVGIGDWHAESQFIFDGHSPSKPFAETLLAAYSAKRRAEVAPGVGKETDMFAMGPKLGSRWEIPQEPVIAELGRIYAKDRGAQGRSASRARTQVRSYVDDLFAAALAVPQASAPKAPAPESVSVPAVVPPENA